MNIEQKFLEELITLLERNHNEIINLRQKINNKEDEGWEGVQRREVLRRDNLKQIGKARVFILNEEKAD